MSKKKRLDSIFIDELPVDCIAGILPHERKIKQPLILHVKIGLDFSKVVKSGDLAFSCDYDRVTNELITFVTFREFLLLEVAAEEIAAWLLGQYQIVETVSVRIDKPMALKGRAKQAAVKIFRSRGDFSPKLEKTAFGKIEHLLETSEASLFMYHIDPGKTFVDSDLKEEKVVEWSIGKGLERNGQNWEGFLPFTETAAKSIEYQNAGEKAAAFFRCCQKYSPGSSSKLRLQLPTSF